MYVEATHLEQINPSLGHNKFYRITTTSHTAIYQWGRRGSVGQCKILSAASVRNDARLVIHDKFDRGYTEMVRLDYTIPDGLFEVLTTTQNRETRKQALTELTGEFMHGWARHVEEDICQIVQCFGKDEDLVVGVIPEFAKENVGWPWSVPIAECLRSCPTATLPEGNGLLAVLPRSALYGIDRVVRTHYSRLVGAAAGVDRSVLEVAAGLWDGSRIGETGTLEGALEVAKLVFADTSPNPTD